MIKLWSEEFEVVSVVEGDNSFKVLVEFSDRSRRGFRFPFEDRFFVKDADGVPFYVRRIQEVVGERLAEVKKLKEGVGSLSDGFVGKGVKFRAVGPDEVKDEKKDVKKKDGSVK